MEPVCHVGFVFRSKTSGVVSRLLGAFLVATVLCGQASAKTWTLKTGGSNAQGLRDCTWIDSEGNTSSVLNPEDDYVAGTSLHVSSVSQDQRSLNTFTGNSLTIGTTGGAEGKLRLYNGNAWFENEGLVLANGSMYVRYFDEPNMIHGNVLVTASVSAPFMLDHICDAVNDRAEYTVNVAGPLSGAGYFKVCPMGVDNKSYGSIRELYLAVCGDASSFTGGITLEAVRLRENESYPWSGELNRAGLRLPDGAMPAAVSVGDHCILSSSSPTNACTLKTLHFGEDTELNVRLAVVREEENDYVTNSSVRVTDSFSFTGDGRIRVSLEGLSVTDPVPAFDVAVLTVPSGSDVSIEDFELEETDRYTGYTSLSLAGNADGSKTLRCSRAALVTQLKSDVHSIVMEAPGTDAVTNGTYWSDGEPPHASAHYYLPGKRLRTPWTPDEAFVLPGLSWTFKGGSEFIVVCKELEMNDMRVLAGGEFSLSCQYTTPVTTVKSDMAMSSAEVVLYAWAKGCLTIDGEISGSGTITCKGNNAGSGHPGGFYRFTGINTNYSGRITVTMQLIENRPLSFSKTDTMRFNSLYVSDSRNLGGAMSPADPKGIVLENLGRMQVEETTEFDEPTRGLYIGWIGRIDVFPGKTMTFRNPLAVNGTLYKDNEGCLALGNDTVTFGADGTDDQPPADSTNRMFIVECGTVKPLSAGCMDGLDVVMSNNTQMVFGMDPEDGELRKYGIRNVKTDSPFTCASGTDTLNVSFEGPAPAATAFTNGLFTVRSAAAAALRAKLSVARPEGHWYAMKLIETSSEDGQYVTISAEFRKVGMVMSVR